METSSKHAHTHLDQDKIVQFVDGLVKSRLHNVIVLDEVSSTNSFLLERSTGIAQADVCLARHQTAGRGRRGNDWQSAANKNIAMSVSWGFGSWPETITGLGLAVSLVVAERLNKEFNIGVQIKWPNDLMFADCKLGGILIDVCGQPGGVCHVVIGLGLNVDQADDSGSSSDYRWQDLKGLGVEPDCNRLCGQLISDLIQMLELYEECGFQPFVTRWNQLNCYQKRDISISAVPPLAGKMIGVDQYGALQLRDNLGEIRTVSDSSLSVRLL